MRFEWDEAKRRSNLAKHFLDFRDVGAVLAEPHVAVEARYPGVERRWLAVGMLDGRFVTVVFTLRAGAIRIISFRRARHDEKARYQILYGSRA